MFNWFKKKVIIDDPPDNPKGEVEFCNPTIPTEVFNETQGLEDFINKIKKK